MEGLPAGARIVGIMHSRPVLTQLADHELAHRVVEIGGVIGAASSLLRGVADILIAFVAEEIVALLDGHALGMETNGGEIAAVAQERIGELADMGFRVAIVKARIIHHLFGIVGPALSEGIADEQLAEHGFRPVRMQEVQEVARPDFVHAGEEQVFLAGHIGIAGLFVPCRVWRGDVIDRWQAGFVGPRNVDIGGVLPVIGRGFLDESLLCARDGHDIVRLDESAQFGQLFTRFLDRANLGLVGAHLGHAIAQRQAGRIGRAGLFQGVLVALQVSLADGFQLSERDIDRFCEADHV